MSRCPALAAWLLAVLAVLAGSAASLRAEDVVITGCVGGSFNPDIFASCPANLGTSGLYDSFSIAVPQGAARSKTMFGISTLATWAVTPTLVSSAGVYRVYVSKGTSYNAPADLQVRIVATSGCTLADTNFVGQTEIDTPAFQQYASMNVWTPVAVITNTSKTPTITFSYASGASSRWYMDEVRFESLSAGAATPATITQILRSNLVSISGTGPVGHAFALVTSADAARPLAQWTPEQTNLAGTGAFTFSLNPGPAPARFYRVITQ